MIEYKEANEPTDLLDDFSEYLDKYAELTEDFNKIGEEELNETERTYYSQVLARTSKKLLDLNNG